MDQSLVSSSYFLSFLLKSAFEETVDERGGEKEFMSVLRRKRILFLRQFFSDEVFNFGNFHREREVSVG